MLERYLIFTTYRLQENWFISSSPPTYEWDQYTIVMNRWNVFWDPNKAIHMCELLHGDCAVRQ